LFWQVGTVKCKRWRGGLAGLVLAASAFPTLATITVNPWELLFQGIEFTTGTADTNEVRQQKVCVLRVDLAEPTLEFFSTPSNGDAPLETFGQTTTAFVQTYGVAVGVNAGFFSPVTTIPNDPRDLSGLAISQGNVVSPHTSGREVLLISRSNAVTIAASPPADYSNIWTAVSGSDLILVNGVVQLTNCSTSFCGPNPRTAVGVSQDGHYLYMMVIDGRQTGWSDGATLAETGAWLLRLGAWNGLNLDGGGSSAMARLEGGAALLLNRPSGGTQRVNGNHLGVFAEPLPGPTLSYAVTNGMLTLWWPANRTGFRLQSATNTLGLGPNANWGDVVGVTSNTITLSLSPSNRAVFFRLILP